MSWHYLRERGAAFSLPDYLGGLQSQQSRSKSTAARSSLLVRPRDISRNSLSGMTSKPSTGDLFGELLMSLPADSPARTSVQLVVEWALPASVAACGLSISDLLRRLGLDLYSPKTSRRSVPVALAPSYQDLPNWGMTYDGVCWELGMSVRPIDATDYGSSLCEGRNHHVPTPTASDHIERVSTSTEKLNYETNKSVSLDRWAKHWPTPSAQESQPTQEFIDEVKANQGDTHERLYLPGRKHHTQRTLSRAVQTWPTPKAADSNPAGAPAMLRYNEKTGRKTLKTEVLKRELWPTPTSSVGSGSRNTPGSKAHPGISLDDAVRGDGGTGRKQKEPMIGTPTARMSRRSDSFKEGRLPSPSEFVESFPTPTSQDHKGRGAGSYDRHKGLDNHVKKFPTPTAGGGGGTSRSGDRQDETPSLEGMARHNRWPTPGAADAKWRDTPHTAQLRKEKGSQLGLHAAVILEGQEQWPTPRAAEWKGTGPLGSKSHVYRVEKGYLDATVQERGQITGPLNPTWVEWLMGWPTGWTDLKQLGTDKFRWWQHRHGLS